MGLHLTSGDFLCFAPRNLPAAVEWYKDKLGCRLPTKDEMAQLQSDEPPAALLILDGGIGVYFYGDTVAMQETVPVLFSSNLEKTRNKLSERALACSAIQQDRSGRSYFEIRDLDGNVIEVCQED